MTAQTTQADIVSTLDAKLAKTMARKKFEGAWEVIRAELLAHFKDQGMPVDAREWYKRVSIIDGLGDWVYHKDLCRIWTTIHQVVNSTEACPWLILCKSSGGGH